MKTQSFAAYDVLIRLAVSLAIGLMIGLERGWEQREMPEGRRVAGFRTLGLTGLLGGVAEVLAPNQVWPIAALFLAVGALAAFGYWRESTDESHLGETTAIAMLLTLALGALAGAGKLTEASSAAVVATLILGFKPELHELLEWLDREELLATLRLLLISVVLLPILPNRGFGPWESINPYKLWWLVVMVAAISYVGYFAIRTLGRNRGVITTGIFGGLVSSTAVALNLSRRASVARESEAPAVPAILVASAIMFPRMIMIIAPVAPGLVGSVARPLALAGAVAFIAAIGFALRLENEKDASREGDQLISNPLDLGSALRFGALLAAIMIAGRGLSVWLGNRGLYLAAAAAGLADVDAISLTIATIYSRGQAPADVAALSILIAAAVNTIVKPALVLAIGGIRMGVKTLIPLLAALAAGAAAYWFLVAVR